MLWFVEGRLLVCLLVLVSMCRCNVFSESMLVWLVVLKCCIVKLLE